MDVNLNELPKGFWRFSMAITILVAVSWWVDYELVPVVRSATTFLPIYLLMMTARVVLGFAFCGACVGIGIGSFVSGITCYRYLSQKSSLGRWARYLRSGFATIVSSIVFFVIYGIGLVSIGPSSVLAYAVMFAGLQVSEFYLLRRILRRRRAKVRVPGT